MHAVLEGVVKRIITMWFDSTNHNGPFYLRRRLSQIDQVFLKQTPPIELSRPPRSITRHLKYWKASEFRSWLLFYSLPLLIDMLPPLYWHHFSLLVCAMHILLQAELSISLIDSADKMLQDFYHLLPELYGQQSCTINAHLLTHLCKYVRLWGPLWTHSSFSFESKNGILKKAFHGRSIIHSQIVFNVDAIHTLQILHPKLNSESPEVLDFIDCSENRNMLEIGSHTYIVGRTKTITATSEELQAIGSCSNPLCIFTRLFKNGELYHSTSWTGDSVRKRDNTICLYALNSCTHFGRLIYFTSANNTNYALVRQLQPSARSIVTQAGHPCRQVLINHRSRNLISSFITVVEDTTSLVAVPVTNILNKAVLVTTPNGKYAIKQPNNCEHN